MPPQLFTLDGALALIASYLIGSIPFGLILTRLSGAGDLRAIGSGNIGATNVLRTGRRGLAAATMILDIAKAFVAARLAGGLAPGFAAAGGAMAVVGHCYPIWLRFRGGKGVATYAGLAFALGWPLGAVYAVLWVFVLIVTRISSLGGLMAAFVTPLAAAMLGPVRSTPILFAVTLLVFWKHRGNLARLARGAEPRIGSGSTRA